MSSLVGGAAVRCPLSQAGLYSEGRMDSAGATIVVESGWMPVNELLRLLNSGASDGGVTVSGEVPEHRGIDPAVAVALISGGFGTLAPFLIEFAKRLFRAEPDAVVNVETEAGPVVLLSSLPEAVRTELVNSAIASGALRVRITLEPDE
ncbi:hypothetical protein [Nocardia sp. NPDC056100]|uniref:hypothetical protein n=1 Tax=Nocardia sp. NPDC056100 TaxID=3345712 RepID=UPI0035D95BDB